MLLRDITYEVVSRARNAELSVHCPGDGNALARIAIIGDAPGEQEARLKIPFVGGSGQKLWTMLQSLGIKRSQVYTTNVAKRQVALSRVNTKLRDPIGAVERRRWTDILLTELQMLPNLEIILLCGNEALRAVTGHNGINNWRGSIIPHELPNGRKVICVCTFNPANIFANPRTEIMVKTDIHKLGLVTSGQWKPYEIEYLINPTLRQLLDYIRLTHNDAVKNDTPVAFDIETPVGQLMCIGFSNDVHSGACINLVEPIDAKAGLYTNRFSLREEAQIWLAISNLLGDQRVRLIAQKGTFDMLWLAYRNHIHTADLWMDTMLAHHLLYPTLPHSLGFITTQYSTLPYHKHERKNKEDVDAYWRYNIKDCVTTLIAANALDRELKEANLSDFFFNHVMRAHSHLIEMGISGVRCDVDLKDYLASSMQSDLTNLEQEFYRTVADATGMPGYTPNPNSHPQMRELYYKRLGIKALKKKSVDAATRERIATSPYTSEEAKRVVAKHGEYKTLHKFVSTYLNVQLDPDNRFRCEYKQSGTTEAPGRLSSASTGWGTGTNLQNQPQSAYPMFITDDGYSFGYFDLSQAEARFVGWDAGIVKWMEQFERARQDGEFDCHRALASEMFNVAYELVPIFDRDENGVITIRFVAKRCRHGLNYRMGPSRLAESAGLPLNEAIAAHMKYHNITPELSTWWERVVEQYKTNKVLYNLYGRRLILLERITDDALDSVIAFRPQSTIGDKVVRVIYQSQEDPKWPHNARIKLNNHDALIAQAPHAKIKTCLSIMKRYAEEPLTGPWMVKRGQDELIIPAELKESYPTSWEYDRDACKVVFHEDPKGKHRWSHMRKVIL